MPKAKAEPTDAQKAVLDIRQKLEMANKALATKPDDAKLKQNVEAGKAALHTAVQAENRERFVDNAGGRVKKSVIAIRNVGNINSTRSYNYSEADVAKAEALLTSEVGKAMAKMRAGLQVQTATAKKPEVEFTF